MDDDTPGGRIRRFRKEIGLSGRAFAAELELSQGYLSEVERNQARPSTRVLEAMLLHFQVNANWVLTGDGPMTVSQAPVPSEREEGAPDLKSLLTLAVGDSPGVVAEAILKALGIDAEVSDRETQALAAVRAIFESGDETQLAALEALLTVLQPTELEEPNQQSPARTKAAG